MIWVNMFMLWVIVNDNIRVDDIEYDDDVNILIVHVIINDSEDNDEIKDIVNEVIWKSKDNSAGLYVDDMIIVDVDVKDDVVKEVTHNVSQLLNHHLWIWA